MAIANQDPPYHPATDSFWPKWRNDGEEFLSSGSRKIGTERISEIGHANPCPGWLRGKTPSEAWSMIMIEARCFHASS